MRIVRNIKSLLVLSATLLGFLEASAQVPAAQFTLQASGCLGESIPLNNTSTQALRYEWDVCQGDLAFTPIGSLEGTISGTQIPTGIDVVFDESNWLGFVASRGDNSIKRLTFDPNLSSIQAQTSLSGIALVSGPIDIKVVADNGNWYAFVLNEGNSIVRLDFGTSLSNTPTATSVLSISSGVGNQGLDVINDGANWFIAYTENAHVSVAHLATIQTIPTGGDIVQTALTGNLSDLKFVKDLGSYYIFATTSDTPRLSRLSFGTSLLSTPAVADLSSILPAGFSYYGVDAANDAGKFYLLMATLSGAIVRVNLGPDLTAAPLSADALGTLGFFSSTLKNRLVRSGSLWNLFAVDYTSGNLFLGQFPVPPCDLNPAVLSLSSPVINFSTAGTKFITLSAIKNGARDEAHHAVAISSIVAPTLDFTSQNTCAQNPVNFTSLPGIPFVSIQWDFGNSTTSLQSNPSVIYATAQSYRVSALAHFGNGCTNYAEKILPVYNPPVADFTLPSATPVCSNQDYLLPNTSQFDVASNPTWEWRVNGTLLSSTQNFAANFSTAVPQTIKLKAVLPGCENEISKTILSVTAGPAVNFTSVNNCFGTPVAFTNTTTGTVTGFSWNFGDATSSMAFSPTHSYPATSSYQVTLTASDPAACNNFKTKSVKIFSVPQPDFSVGAPPFSCTGLPTPFQNNTPALTDSNITDWQWQFNDAAAGTSGSQSPSYTFSTVGNYNVTLQASSDAGCTKSITKPVNIVLSPVADFAIGPACLNVATKFTDLSSGSIVSRNWQIGPASFTSQNPSYAFTSTGNFSSTLTINSTNGCSSVKVKTITVPVPPLLNFTGVNLCAGKDALFTDITSSPQDNVVGWNWNFDGNSSTGNPATFQFATTGTYNAKLTTTHASGCKYTLSKNLAINVTPVAAFIATPDRGEAPLTVQFTNSSQQATSYSWKFYDKTVATSILASPAYTFTALGDYSAELTAVNGFGCSDIKTAPIKVLVPVVDLELTGFSVINDAVTAKLKGVVSIQNNGNVPVAYADVALVLSDKTSVNETVRIDLAPGQSVTKTLSFTIAPEANSFLCAEIISEKDQQPSNNKQCINFENGNFYFNPYPNPVAGPLQVDWISGTAGIARIIIHDSMGRKVFDWQTPCIAGLNRATLDLSLFQTGLYFVTIETGQSKKTTRLLHQ